MADGCRAARGYGHPNTTGVWAAERARARSDAGRQKRGRPDVIVTFTPQCEPSSDVSGVASSTRRFFRLERGTAKINPTPPPKRGFTVRPNGTSPAHIFPASRNAAPPNPRYFEIPGKISRSSRRATARRPPAVSEPSYPRIPTWSVPNRNWNGIDVSHAPEYSTLAMRVRRFDGREYHATRPSAPMLFQSPSSRRLSSENCIPTNDFGVPAPAYS